VRALLIAIALLVGTGGVANAKGLVVINTGDDILHLRDLDADKAAMVGYGKLGYRYDLFGVFWVDIWRSDGEFVVYEGSTYSPITDEELEMLGGASVPWRYHLPEGLLIILALIELAIVSRTRRKVKTAFILGGILVAFAILIFFKGLTWEFMIPLLLGLHHILTGYSAMKRAPEEDETTSSSEEAQTQSGAHRASQAAMSDRNSQSGARRISQSGEHRAHRDSQAGMSDRTSQSGARRISQSGEHRVSQSSDRTS